MRHINISVRRSDRHAHSATHPAKGPRPCAGPVRAARSACQISSPDYHDYHLKDRGSSHTRASLTIATAQPLPTTSSGRSASHARPPPLNRKLQMRTARRRCDPRAASSRAIDAHAQQRGPDPPPKQGAASPSTGQPRSRPSDHQRRSRPRPGSARACRSRRRARRHRDPASGRPVTVSDPGATRPPPASTRRTRLTPRQAARMSDRGLTD